MADLHRGSSGKPLALLIPGRAKRMAHIWGSRLIDAGPLGHINAQSNMRDWPYGRFILRRLISAATPPKTALVAGGSFDTLTHAGTRAGGAAR